MNIGNNIYILRKEKKLTQTQLAEKLCVSEQAISKWENGQCAPDISLFPLLADIFGVSIDLLFGYHKKSYTDEVEEIMKSADDTKNTYKEIEIICEGLKRFPNSPELKIYLSFSLSMLYRISEDEAEKKDAVNRAVKLCHEVIDNCGDTEQVDSALNMLRRIYCDTGEYQKALKAVSRISGENYGRRVMGKAQILQYSKAYSEHEEYTEKHLFECFLLMDALFELKRKTLAEKREYKQLISWCNAHDKLLSCFDEGCEDFYSSHKFWNCERRARAYKNLGDKCSCLLELKKLAAISKSFNPDSHSEDHQIGVRNPLFFSTITDPGTQEEYMSEIDLKQLLCSYDEFFRNDTRYAELKNNV